MSNIEAMEIAKEIYRNIMEKGYADINKIGKEVKRATKGEVCIKAFQVGSGLRHGIQILVFHQSKAEIVKQMKSIHQTRTNTIHSEQIYDIIYTGSFSWCSISADVITAVYMILSGKSLHAGDLMRKIEDAGIMPSKYYAVGIKNDYSNIQVYLARNAYSAIIKYAMDTEMIFDTFNAWSNIEVITSSTKPMTEQFIIGSIKNKI